MDRGRIKTTLLLLLLTVNLVFLGIIVTDRVEAARLESEARTALTEALARMGIAVAYGAIPREEAQPRYFIGRDVDAEREVATALLGEPEARDEGGGIYHYQSPLGQAQFRGGTFWLAFQGQSYSVLETGALVERMGLTDNAGTGDDVYRTYSLRIEGRRVQNGQVTFHFADGYVRELGGSALWGARQGYAAGPQQDVATALIILAGYLREIDTVSRFERVEMGYYLLEGPGYLELRPVWLVETDVGIFSVDRQSGEVRR